jgi:O-antigen biosynthesis protein
VSTTNPPRTARRSTRLGQLRRRVGLVVHWTLKRQLHTQIGFWIRSRRAARSRATAYAIPPALLPVPNPRELHLPRAEKAVVSIIIPTFGNPDVTLACLASIAADPSNLGIEIIVVDDASPGQAAAVLELIDGIHLIASPTNHGFIHACNTGARCATGEFLLFLNNDTQVMVGWLEPLVRLFREFPDVGAVGSKLIFPDGRLQEAGCIIWQDGTGWNLGRGDDASEPVFNYVREVDYCSGASLMVPRTLFERLGGFDERYAPAYFEDADISFKLRALGYRTLYQPRSVVVHIEGESYGRDEEESFKSQCIARNRITFVDLWRSVLQEEQFSNGQHWMRARDRAKNRRIILVADHAVPEPDRDAGSRTMFNFVQAFSASNVVTKFWPQNLLAAQGYTENLQNLGIEVIYGAGIRSIDEWISHHGSDLDAVLLSRPHVAEALLPVLRRHKVGPVLYYGHDIHFQRLAAENALRPSVELKQEVRLMEARERAVWRQVDVVLYPSVEETHIVNTLEPNVVTCAVQPYAFGSFGASRPATDSTEILFVAGFAHPPNEDAAVWFVNEVLPLVRRSVTQARMTIVGSNPTDRVRALKCDCIEVYSNVSDTELIESYRRSRVAVVPLRYGAGVKLKVVEALREGLPLVTTAVGAQGIPDLANVACVCDDPSHFAAEVSRLLVNDELWVERCEAQIRYAKAHYSDASIRESLMSALAAAKVGVSGDYTKSF